MNKTYRNIDEHWGACTKTTVQDYQKQAEYFGDTIDIEERDDGIYINGERVATVVETPDTHALEADVAEVEAISVGDYYLYDSETNDMLSAEDIGITDAEYVAACSESLAATPEGHIVVAGRRVYAAE